jgi:hypothetical protein
MIFAFVALVIMFASLCVAYKMINTLKKELDRFKYNELHYKAVLKEVESFFRTMDSCRGYPPNTDIGKIADIAFKHWLYVEALEEKLRRK